MRVRSVPTSAGILSSFLLSMVALAGDDHRAAKAFEVDIESLKGELFSEDEDNWSLEVRYDVEIEYPAPGDEFDLLLYVSEDDRQLTDADGKTIDYLIALESPTELRHDEVEFEHRTTLSVPRSAIHSPDRLRLHALVTYRGQERSLAVKNKSIKYRPPVVRCYEPVVSEVVYERVYLPPRVVHRVCVPRHRVIIGYGRHGCRW